MNHKAVYEGRIPSSMRDNFGGRCPVATHDGVCRFILDRLHLRAQSYWNVISGTLIASLKRKG